MIATLRRVSEETQFVQQRFLAMLPQIRRQALRAFRNAAAEARAELTQEVIALAFAMFVRLVRRGKVGLAYPTPLTNYAIRQVRAGRRVGCRQNVQDIMSPVAMCTGPDDPTSRSTSRADRWFELNVMRRSADAVRLKRQRRAWIWRLGFASSRRGIGGSRGHWRSVSKPMSWPSDLG